MQFVCAICGKVQDSDNTIRVSKAENSRIRFDAEDFIPDSGLILCRDAKCIQQARADRLIETRFGVPAGEVYLRIAGMIQHAPAERLERLIGMGIRSRKIVLGRTGVEMAVKDRKVRLLLVSAETQKNTREWVEAVSRSHRIPLLLWPGPKPLEDVVHKANCRVAGVVDAGLGEEIRKQIDITL